MLSLSGFSTNQANSKKPKTFTIIVLRRCDHGQLNIKLSKKEYRILASQDNYIFVMNKCSKFYTDTIVIPPQEHVNIFSHKLPKKRIRENRGGESIKTNALRQSEKNLFWLKSTIWLVTVMLWMFSGGFNRSLGEFRWFQLVSGWFQVVSDCPLFSSYEKIPATLTLNKDFLQHRLKMRVHASSLLVNLLLE